MRFTKGIVRRRVKKKKSAPVLEYHFDVAIDSAVEALDEAREGGDKKDLHESAKFLRALITAEKINKSDVERMWS